MVARDQGSVRNRAGSRMLMYGYPTPRFSFLLPASGTRVSGKLPLVCLPCGDNTTGFYNILYYVCYEVDNGLHIPQMYLEVESVAIAILLL